MRITRLALLVWIMLLARTGYTQTAGAIAGIVKDGTGGVLPGVTVEASSPALIERARTATTDGQGLYSITDLRPGTYTVTFTLPGFNTVKRDGVTLTTNFTATVNSDMSVGSLEETLTVSGRAPTVDVHNTVKQIMISREMIDNLPTQKGVESVAVLVPGMKSSNLSDVGGTTGQTYATNAIHGGRAGDQRYTSDGFKVNNINGDGAGGGYTIYVNPESVQEISVSTDNIGAESELGGVLINTVPKDGGNTFSGSTVFNGARGSMQANNLTSDLEAAGLHSVARTHYVYDANFAGGGPIVKNRLWFFNANRWWGNESTVAGIYYPVDPLAWVPNPDLSRPAITRNTQRANYLRLTSQLNPSNKVTVSYDNQHSLIPFAGLTSNSTGGVANAGGGGAGTIAVVGGAVGSTTSPEAATIWDQLPTYTAQAKWTSTVSSKLLLEGGASAVIYNRQQYFQPGITPDVISVLDQGTGFRYRAANQVSAPSVGDALLSHTFNERMVATYVTGSHNIRLGVNTSHGWQAAPTFVNQDILYTFNNGTPLSLTLRATPLRTQTSFGLDLGLFAQDQWTVKRLTLNYGMRFTRSHAQADAVDVEAGRFVGPRHYDADDCLPCSWKDLTPRFGVAYDVRGDGKTALKFGLNKYLRPYTNGIAVNFNPQASVVGSANRSWGDANHNYVPDCDLLNPSAQGECGATSPGTFGSQVQTSFVDPDFLKGWGKRDTSNWQVNLGIQQDLPRGLSVNIAYYRRWYENFLVTDNQLTTPSDYSSYCVTAPVDSRLPSDVSGSQICGLYDINPDKFGKVQNLYTFADNYGKKTDIFNGIDFLVSQRIGAGGFLSGGVSYGNERINQCDLAANTENPTLAASATAFPGLSTRFCNTATNPFWQANIKINGSYPLPWYGLQASAAFQSSPGAPIYGTATFSNAQIAPSLQRNLSAGVNGTVQVPLIEPGTAFGDRLNQLDVRLAKRFKLPHLTAEADLDLYNAFNSSPVLAFNTVYGSAWLTPTTILGGRLAKVGVRLTF